MSEMSDTTTYARAVCEALYHKMDGDKDVIVMGLGVTDEDRVFGTTEGLVEEYGTERVVETPVSEPGFTGMAIGMAMMGKPVVISHQRVEFALLSLQQLVMASHMNFVTNGEFNVPIVVRLIIGRGWGQGPDHGQSLIPLFAHIPGLTVVYPSTLHDAYGMMISAIEHPHPVIFFEHRWLHGITFNIDPLDLRQTPLEGCKIVHQGNDDITFVSYGYGVQECRIAAEAMKQAGCNPMVFDLRNLSTLDINPICSHLLKSQRLIFVEDGWDSYGVGRQLISSIPHEMPYQHIRLAWMSKPVPSSPALAADYYVTAQDIVEAAMHLLGGTTYDMQQARSFLPEREHDKPPQYTGPF